MRGIQILIILSLVFNPLFPVGSLKSEATETSSGGGNRNRFGGIVENVGGTTLTRESCPKILKESVLDDFADKRLGLFKSESKTCQSAVKSYQDFLTRDRGSAFQDPAKLSSELSDRFKTKIAPGYKNVLSGCQGKNSGLTPEQMKVAEARFYNAAAQIEAFNSEAVEEISYLDSLLEENGTLQDIECGKAFPEIETKCKKLRDAGAGCKGKSKDRFDALAKKTTEALQQIQGYKQAYRRCYESLPRGPAVRGDGRPLSAEGKALEKKLCSQFSDAIRILEEQNPLIKGKEFQKLAIKTPASPRNGIMDPTFHGPDKIVAALKEQLKADRKLLSDNYKKNYNDFTCLTYNTDTNGKSCDYAKIRENLNQIKPAEVPIVGDNKDYTTRQKNTELQTYFEAESCFIDRGVDRNQAINVIDDAAINIGLTVATAGVGVLATGLTRGSKLLVGGKQVTMIRPAANAKLAPLITGAIDGAHLGYSASTTFKGCVDSSSRVQGININPNRKPSITDNVCADPYSPIGRQKEIEDNCLVNAALAGTTDLLPFMVGIPSMARAVKSLKDVPQTGGLPPSTSAISDVPKPTPKPDPKPVAEAPVKPAADVRPVVEAKPVVKPEVPAPKEKLTNKENEDLKIFSGEKSEPSVSSKAEVEPTVKADKPAKNEKLTSSEKDDVQFFTGNKTPDSPVAPKPEPKPVAQSTPEIKPNVMKGDTVNISREGGDSIPAKVTSVRNTPEGKEVDIIFSRGDGSLASRTVKENPLLNMSKETENRIVDLLSGGAISRMNAPSPVVRVPAKVDTSTVRTSNNEFPVINPKPVPQNVTKNIPKSNVVFEQPKAKVIIKNDNQAQNPKLDIESANSSKIEKQEVADTPAPRLNNIPRQVDSSSSGFASAAAPQVNSFDDIGFSHSNSNHSSAPDIPLKLSSAEKTPSRIVATARDVESGQSIRIAGEEVTVIGQANNGGLVVKTKKGEVQEIANEQVKGSEILPAGNSKTTPANIGATPTPGSLFTSKVESVAIDLRKADPNARPKFNGQNSTVVTEAAAKAVKPIAKTDSIPQIPDGIKLEKVTRADGSDIYQYKINETLPNGDVVVRTRQMNMDQVSGGIDANYPAGKDLFEEIVKTKAGRSYFAFLDVGNLGQVNKTFKAGNTAGDEYLKAVANAVREKGQGKITLARLGGDEYGLVIDTIHPRKAKAIMADIQKSVQMDMAADARKVFRQEKLNRAQEYRDAIQSGDIELIAQAKARIDELSKIQMPTLSVGLEPITAGRSLESLKDAAEASAKDMKIQIALANGRSAEKYGSKATPNAKPKPLFMAEIKNPKALSAEDIQIAARQPATATTTKRTLKESKTSEVARFKDVTLAEYTDELGRKSFKVEKYVTNPLTGKREVVLTEIPTRGSSGLLDGTHPESRSFAEGFMQNVDQGMLLMPDVKSLKYLNYFERGSEAGNDVLQAMAEAIQSVTRSTDLKMKLNGGSFLIATKNTGTTEYSVITKRLKEALLENPRYRKVIEQETEAVEKLIAQAKASGKTADEIKALEERLVQVKNFDPDIEFKVEKLADQTSKRARSSDPVAIQKQIDEDLVKAKGPKDLIDTRKKSIQKTEEKHNVVFSDDDELFNDGKISDFVKNDTAYVNKVMPFDEQFSTLMHEVSPLNKDVVTRGNLSLESYAGELGTKTSCAAKNCAYIN